MIEFLVAWITQAIQAVGYVGVFILMAFESMILPVPSEAVMPFAGFLVSQGTFSFWTVVLVSTLGSIAGSLISYAIGYYGGLPFVHRLGKYFFLNKRHLEWTHRFFEKKGSLTIFVSRFIPVVRHLISIPAGVAKMDLKRFIFFTTIGAAIWNTFLLYVGMKLAENWTVITKYTKFLDIAVIVIIVAYIFLHVRHAAKKRKKRNP
jgi:membrane protein DedA with SNARE-associated domain